MKHNATLLITGAFVIGLASPSATIASPMDKVPLHAPKHKQKSITKIDPITIETPVGTVPRLPWQVWVT